MDGGKCKMENVKWTMDNEHGRQQIIMNSWSSESRATFAIEREHAKLA